MKKIVYYITDHGLGHATRSIAIIRKILKNNIEVTIRNSNAVDFISKSLSGIKIKTGITDIGPKIKKDGLSIDILQSRKQINPWIDNLEKFASKEELFLTKIKPNLIISDISAMPFIVAKKLDIPSMAISNFSWYDAYNFLTKKRQEKLFDAYQNANLAIKLPYGTDMKHFQNLIKTGLICRIPTMNKSKIKNKLDVKNSEKIVVFALGGGKSIIKFRSNKDVKIFSLNTKIDKKIKSTDLSSWIEGQEIISIADVIFCKCGYGFISEALTNGIPFYYLKDPNHKEQNHMDLNLKEKNFGVNIEKHDLNNLEFNQKFFDKIKPQKKQKIDYKVIDLINEILK